MMSDVGIWGLLAYIENQFQFNSWTLSFSCLDKTCILSKDGYILQNLPLSFVTEIKKYDENNLLYYQIPIDVNGKLMFVYSFYVSNVIDEMSLFVLKKNIEAYLSIEALDLEKYQTIFPFFFPVSDSSININKNILDKSSRFFFLNGQEGTGKKVFIQNHVLFNYKMDIYNLFRNNNNNSVIRINIENIHVNCLIIRELALLNVEEQEKILKDFNMYTHIYVCSAYNLNVLLEKNIVIHEFASFLTNNKIIFSSINRRIAEIISSINYVFAFKGHEVSDLISFSKLSKLRLKKGLSDIYEILKIMLYMKNISQGDFLSHNGLRDIISKIEVDSIKLGHFIYGSSQNKIAKYLGISRGSLQHKLKKLNFPYNEWEE